MKEDISNYISNLDEDYQEIANHLFEIIEANLVATENKIWHRHPVWFIDGNPIVGFDKLKNGLRLMFWSGASFNEKELKIGTGKFKDASITYTSLHQVNTDDVKRWVEKASKIQWDYKNIVKRKGRLEPLVGIE
jgi:hypothetical protein